MIYIQLEKQSTEDTIYLIASITKTITATALMQLYEQGLFDLDDDVNNFLNFNFRNPNYPDDPITFRMLLSHQSSLSEESLSCLYKGFIPDGHIIPLDSWLEDYLVPGESEYTPEVWVNKPPGNEFHYSNVGYCLIGYLIERITNQSYVEYCKDNIFIPLNMDDTDFLFSDMDLDRLSIPYVVLNKKYFIPLQHYITRFYPAGCLRTTVLDLSHFLIAHMNGGTYNGVQILEEDAVELMHTIHSPKSRGFQYGLGWMISKNKIGTTFMGHIGRCWGYSTTMRFSVSDDVAVIYFINRFTNGYIEGVTQTWIEHVLFLTSYRY